MSNEHFTQILENLIAIPSPTGQCNKISNFIQNFLHYKGFFSHTLVKNSRGHLRYSAVGKNPQAPKLTWVSHADTLGVIVNSSYMADDGCAYAWLDPIGGLYLEDVINARVTFSWQGKKTTGTILFSDSGPHCGQEVQNKSRYLTGLETGFFCRLDTHLALPKNTIGHFQPDFYQNAQGFIVSRHIDSKADVAIMLSVMQLWMREKYMPPHPVDFVFNMDEETGFATNLIAEDTDTCIALEFIPTELGCNIKDIGSIKKDGFASATPETLEMLSKAGVSNQYIVPNFGSDATLAIHSGRRLKHATVGFGLDKSHGAERTHIFSLGKLEKFVSTFRLT